MKRSHIFMAVLVIVGFYAAVGSLFMFEPPPGAREPLLILVGSLAAAFGAVVGYFFGSSSGSAEKTALLSERK